MKLRTLFLFVLLIAGLTACSRRTESMTGQYGDAFLSGEVFMTSSHSPAGVVVSVPGTGMTTVLGEDGRFSFAGVPDGAGLSFRRQSDGVNASMQLDRGVSHVVVELGQTTAQPNAKRSSKRRGVPSGDRNRYEFEGTIVSVAAGQLVMFTSKKVEVTILLTAETIIRKGDRILTPADLAPNMRVHVKAKKEGDAYVALLVIVQRAEGDEEEEEPSGEFEGTIVSATADQLVVFTSKKREETFALTADTRIRKGNETLTAADLAPGMRVHVKARKEGEIWVAQQVKVQRT